MVECVEKKRGELIFFRLIYIFWRGSVPLLLLVVGLDHFAFVFFALGVVGRMIDLELL